MNQEKRNGYTVKLFLTVPTDDPMEAVNTALDIADTVGESRPDLLQVNGIYSYFTVYDGDPEPVSITIDPRFNCIDDILDRD